MKRKESVRRGRKKGSGSRYSRALADRICTHIRCGDSLRKAAQKEGVPHPTVLKWVGEGGEFRDQYARACEEWFKSVNPATGHFVVRARARGVVECVRGEVVGFV